MMPSKWFVSFLGLLFIVGALFLWKKNTPQVQSANAVLADDLLRKFQIAKPIERVKDFYLTESKRVGQVDSNPKETQERLAKLAKELNADELLWLKVQALNAKEEGDARFFSAYLLALNHSEPAISLLREISLSSLPNIKNKSALELEKVIRAQAIEGLGHQRGNLNARDALLDVITSQSDVYLQDRAHRALYEYEKGKPVEQTDREGLSDLLYGTKR